MQGDSGAKKSGASAWPSGSELSKTCLTSKVAIDSGSDRKSSSNDSFIQVVKALSLMNCDAETSRVPAHAGGNGVEMSDGWLLNLEQRTNAKIRKGKERKMLSTAEY